MKTKKLLLWILQGVILLLLTFLTLLAVFYFFEPAWLTDRFAWGFLALEALIHCAVGIIKIKSQRTSGKKRMNARPNMRPSDDIVSSRHHKKARKSPILVCILAAFAVAILGVGSYKLISHNNLKNVPEEVIEFGERYPEAQDYVDHFNKYVNKDFDMDVSEEMSKAGIPLFIQWDKRWGYKNYGENYIGLAGCAPTCMAMVVCGLKQDPEINPYVVASYSADQGFYTYGEGTSWRLMTEGAEHYGLNAAAGTVSADFIVENLSSKTPMICSMGPGDFTSSGHFIVLTGIDSDGKIIVNDPNSPNNSGKHWEVDTLVAQMKGIWEYSIS